MPNIIVNKNIGSQLTHITLPVYVQILSFIRKKGFDAVRIQGVNPLSHPDIQKLIQIAKRGNFHTTVCIEMNTIYSTGDIRDIDIIEIDIKNPILKEKHIIQELYNRGKIMLVDCPIEITDKSLIREIQKCKESGIKHFRLSPIHDTIGEHRKNTDKRDFGKYLYEIAQNIHFGISLHFGCGISPEIFTEKELANIKLWKISWVGGCDGYPGGFDIDMNGLIKKCSLLGNLYKKDSLRLDNYENTDDLYESIERKISHTTCISYESIQEREEMPFDQHPGFYEEDNRKNRWASKTTKEHLEKKNSVALPPDLIQGKSILDLGSCIGAMGQWALFYGATSYTGVEIQEEYASISQKLLAHHGEKAHIIHSSLEDFFEQNTQKFDIVICLGVLYVMIDYYKILANIANCCKEHIVIEHYHPNNTDISPHAAGVLFIDDHGINIASKNTSLIGRGTHMSPKGLEFLMEGLGYNSTEGVLLPKKIYQGFYTYKKNNIGRYLMRFYKGGEKKLSLSEKLQKNQLDILKKWEGPVDLNDEGNIQKKKEDWIEKNSWKFDSVISGVFQEHAKKHIPDYKYVINLCIKIISKYFEKDIHILEFGSALGYTIDLLKQSGFTDILGIEKSPSMIENTLHKEHVREGDSLESTDGIFDVIIANWTLHFIAERGKYLESFFEQMHPGGILFITDKVASSEISHELYLDFKRAGGLSESEIENKTRSLKGVLHPYDVTWYYETIRSIGFKSIDIVYASPCFVTFMIQK